MPTPLAKGSVAQSQGLDETPDRAVPLKGKMAITVGAMSTCVQANPRQTGKWKQRKETGGALFYTTFLKRATLFQAKFKSPSSLNRGRIEWESPYDTLTINVKTNLLPPE